MIFGPPTTAFYLKHDTVYTYSMSDFKLRPLHRQRSRRRTPVAVFNHEELAARLEVTVDEVKAKLVELGWSFHEDSGGNLWATPQDTDEG